MVLMLVCSFLEVLGLVARATKSLHGKQEHRLHGLAVDDGPWFQILHGLPWSLRLPNMLLLMWLGAGYELKARAASWATEERAMECSLTAAEWNIG